MSDSRLAPRSTVAALFRDHHGELVRLAVLMVGDLPTAEDVVQDVYASLHGRPREPQDPLPYVRAAVLNGCRSVLRRRGIARRVTVVHRASQRHDEALASAESEVILSEAEIAAVLRISPGTVKSTAARGLAGGGSGGGERRAGHRPGAGPG